MTSELNQLFPSDSAPVTLDGRSGEGGGQILRSALTLAMLTGRSLYLTDIRGNRPQPGLRPQHLECVQAAKALCQAQVQGAQLDSSRLQFHPGPIGTGNFSFRIPTAGSTALLLHTLYLPLWLTGEPFRLTLGGGTHVALAPSFDYLQRCWQPSLLRLGLDLQLSIQQHGFYPRGGGEIAVTGHQSNRPEELGQEGQDPISKPIPTSAEPIDWTERGDLQQLIPILLVVNLPPELNQRMLKHLRQIVKPRSVRNCLSEPDYLTGSALGAGCIFGLHAIYANTEVFFFAIGKKGVPAENLVSQTVREWELFHQVAGATTEHHLADQMLLPACARVGSTRFTTSAVTQHLLTNAMVLNTFLNRTISVDGPEGEPATIFIAPR